MCLNWPGYGSCLEGYSNQVIQATLCRPGIDFIDACDPVMPSPQPLRINDELDGAILSCVMCMEHRQDVGWLTALDVTC
jgi:hypothetical protein